MDSRKRARAASLDALTEAIEKVEAAFNAHDLKVRASLELYREYQGDGEPEYVYTLAYCCGGSGWGLYIEGANERGERAQETRLARVPKALRFLAVGHLEELWATVAKALEDEHAEIREKTRIAEALAAKIIAAAKAGA